MNSSILIADQVDLDASCYIRNSSLQNSFARRILKNYRISQHAHILDVGCGDGRITAELAIHAKKGSVIGLDASPSMIKSAFSNFPKTKYPNLDFRLGMAEDVSFSQQFDLIVSFSCFHWLRDPEKAIRQLSSSLKQHGEMLILTYPKESPYYKYLQIALKNYPDYYPLSANNTMLSAKEYNKIIKKNNLEIIDFKKHNLFTSYNNPNEIQQYIKGWLSNYVQLPEYLQDSFLQDVSSTVTNDPATHRGKKITIPYTALVIKARKQE